MVLPSERELTIAGIIFADLFSFSVARKYKLDLGVCFAFSGILLLKKIARSFSTRTL